MARRTVVEHTDDLDGSAATETVAFGLDGVDYEIDLSARNAARLRSNKAAQKSDGCNGGARCLLQITVDRALP